MGMPTTAYLATVWLLIFSATSSSSSSPSLVAAAAVAHGSAHESFFLRCFLSHSLPSHLVYTPNTTSYYDVFRSSVQNLRFLSSGNARPVLIVTPTREAHAQAAVVCSRRHGLRVRVRSGGHDYEGLSYVAAATSGGANSSSPFVVVDLANLRAIDVDMETRTAWVGAGATVGELYYTIAKNSPTAGFPAGTCPTVGLGGHFSGGGLGTMMRKYGLAADNVVDARMVDARGRILDRTSMGEDLFWAIRGGGAASFGIILAYRVRLVDVPHTVTVFTIHRTLQQNATKLVARWQRVADRFDDDLFFQVFAQAVGDQARPNQTIDAQFKCLYLGGAEELLAYMGEAFPELGVQTGDLLELTWIDSVKYFAGYQNSSTEVLLDRTPEFNISFKAKSDFLEHPITEEGWERIWGFVLNSTVRPIMIIEPFGGRMGEVRTAATPFPHRRGSRYSVQYITTWIETEEAVTRQHLEGMRELYASMAPFVSRNPRAAYLNYRDIDLGRNEGEGGGSYMKAREWGTKYFKGNFKRLAYVKGKVDPDNFFRNEQSIPPLFAL